MQRKLENTDLNAVTFEVEMSATRSTSFGSCACQRKQSTEPLPLMGLQSAVLALGPGQTSCPLSPHQTPCEASAAVPTVGPSILAASPQIGTFWGSEHQPDTLGPVVVLLLGSWNPSYYSEVSPMESLSGPKSYPQVNGLPTQRSKCALGVGIGPDGYGDHFLPKWPT